MVALPQEVYMYESRIKKLQVSLKEHEVDCIALTPGPSFYYFTGLTFHLMERPVIAFIRPDHPLAILLPDLERVKAEKGYPEAALYGYDETAAGREKAMQEAASALQLNQAAVGIEPLRCRAFELWMLQSAAAKAVFMDSSNLLGTIRAVKHQEEITHMKKAARIAEQALETLLPTIKPGLTEKEIAGELIVQLLRAGSDPELPFEPIVASGPNSALPHAAPTSRKLREGDLLLFDWGARSSGYISDITRTFAVGEVDPRLKDLYRAVLEANRSGRSTAAPGLSGADIDRKTTKVLLDAGYEDYVRHRTGHGIGLEAHEEPYLSKDQLHPLQQGMTFTIEPGLYIHGLGGVRIEDDIVLSPEGAESLTTMTREWRQL